MNRRLTAERMLLILIVVLAAMCLCTSMTICGGVLWFNFISATPTLALPPTLPPPPFVPPTPPLQQPTDTPTPPISTPTISPTATYVPTPTPTSTPSHSQSSTESLLLNTDLPQRDLRLLAERLKKVGPVPKVVNATPPVYKPGDELKFWVGNVDTMKQYSITAVLRYTTPHLYVWVEKGLDYDHDALIRSAENFEQHIYPTNRAFFGSEWSPGVDNDPRLHILHTTSDRMGNSVAGYYSSADEYSRLANPYSNEKEMFYISLSSMLPGTDFYDGVLAHEFQHMIHWANDRNEETWVNEGCSELASYLNGYDPGGFEWLFLLSPDVQLTTWEESIAAAPHYGSSYLFMSYFLGRFGEEAMRRVIAQPANGIAGFDAVLSDYGLTFEDVFADWLIANYLDDRPNTDLRYNYPKHSFGMVTMDITHDRYPVQRKSTVRQYAADYVELRGSGDLLIEFKGKAEARLVPADAHSGRYAWWANRGDDSDARLTRSFELPADRRATLHVWMWYDIEKDWDYAYVEVSTDGGRTWDILPGPSTTTSNPNGNSFGAAYTGSSGGWIEERFDLAPYAGQKILLRFEYVTDDAVNRAGWLLDDISIPEIGYHDDVESGANDWQSEGFIRSDNRVSQRYLVQLIIMESKPRVVRMSLDERRHGRLELHGLGRDFDSAVLVISALAPVTTEVASYEYEIRPLH